MKAKRNNFEIFGKVNITSWANARVKLHSQVHFRSQKILSTKNVWVPKMLVPKFVCVQHSFVSKKFWAQLFFGLGPKMHLRMEFDSGVGPTCFSLFCVAYGVN